MNNRNFDINFLRKANEGTAPEGDTGEGGAAQTAPAAGPATLKLQFKA